MSFFRGVVPAVVKGLQDPEGMGRLQVQLPRLPGETRTFWASVAAPMAGNGRGFFFQPEKDDEVLVAFEEGNPHHPYIIGFMWNGVDKPPESDLQNRVIVTPGGHTIRFEDKDGARKIVIRSSTKHEITLDDAPGAGKIELRSAGGLKIAIDDTGPSSIKLEGGGRTLALQSGLVQIS
jgi:uncharacterized protein involved in type VI secretion and phage assembly